jgi:thioesterase domain-containing protein
LARYIDGKEKVDLPMETGTGDEQTVLLREGTTDKQFFFIHDGTGEVQGYMELVNLLPAGYCYWGIRAERTEHFVPRPLTVEEMARSYVEKIKILQPRGPYYIAGWSIGGTIAFEMVHQLEKMGDAVGFFALIDTLPPLSPVTDPGQRRTRESVYNITITRLLEQARNGYVPGGKLKTPVHFIDPSNREMTWGKQWHPYCQLPMKFHKVSGDHFSIMKQPHVVSAAKIFNTLL